MSKVADRRAARRCGNGQGGQERCHRERPGALHDKLLAQLAEKVSTVEAFVDRGVHHRQSAAKGKRHQGQSCRCCADGGGRSGSRQDGSGNDGRAVNHEGNEGRRVRRRFCGAKFAEACHDIFLLDVICRLHHVAQFLA